ncbi:MAG: MTH1187 family thiamine-binding protein [Candidatus Aminicenantes bacterium]|nr:MAG: MTH1187 family thiamine-binding protein [Candidatus Aminicenantes bacterium]
MLAEFTIFPIGKDVSLSKYVARSLKLIDESGLPYRINPMGTVVEGSWDDIMELIKKCHMAILEDTERVSTSVKIDDRKGITNALDSKIKSVEEKVGRELRK